MDQFLKTTTYSPSDIIKRPLVRLKEYQDRSRNNHQMPIIKLAFFRPPDDSVSWWKNITSWIAGQYIDQTQRYYDHVELRLSNGQVTSITKKHGKVFLLDEKLLDREGYSCFYQTTITQQQEDELRTAIRHYVAKETAFNTRGMYCNFLPGLQHCFGVDAEGERVFCSEYIVRILQCIGIFTEEDAHKISPSDLMRLVQQDDAWKPSYNRELSQILNSK